MSHTIKSLATRVGTSGVLVLLTLFVALSQPVRTSPSPVMFPTASAPAVADAAPQVGATSVTFTMLATCGDNTNSVDVLVGGTVVGVLNVGNDCTCEASLKSFTTSDPAALALLGDGCANVTVGATARTGAYISWIRADINRSGSLQGVCIMDTNGGSCTEPNLCNAGYTNYGNPTGFTATAVAPDADGDGQSNCADPDSDNDSVLNAADNCPLVSNVTQEDTDGNGLGDACDPFDRDADGVWNINDNCMDIPNPSQADGDTDGIGDACEVGLVAVPWLGSEVLPHQVTPGGTIVLQAVATGPTGEPIALASASWNPGDGSGAVAVPHTNSLVIEKTHTYAGVVGQPFTATVTATDTDGNVYTDNFNVVIAANNRETRVNMAIDKGLWNLHKEMNPTTSDGQPSAFWTQNQTTYNMTATANAVQAFAINNHRESGDPSRDPYVRNVARGMRYILSEQHGMLRRLDVPTQNGNNPDDNGNGYGLWIDAGGHASYLGGSFIDAIVASGTPNRTADVGQATYVRGRRYIDIVQDMLDGYSWGMADDRGGWYYSYQGTNGNNDTSASHWWAIGVLAAEVWDLDAPEWVKNIQRTVGIPLMQNATTGAFGYTNNQNPLWDDATNVTSAGMIMMNADDMASSNARFTAASNYMNTRYASSTGNFYTMFQLTKAMRTALDDNGVTAPIELLNGTTDWYAGYADFLVANQNGAGAFTQTIGTAPINEDMATAWAIIILSPSLFELPPTAACSASPSTLGTNGGLVQFSAAASSHPDPDATIVSYAWNFGDGGTSTGVTTSHTFVRPASFPTTYEAQVTVTDSNGLSTSSTCAVTIVDTNVPPNPVTGGPYDVCIGSPVILNGTASADEDGTIASYAWSWGVINFATPNATSATVDATAAFTALGPGVHNVGLQVTDNDGASGSAFTTVRIRAANDATCNQPPAAVNDTASTFSGTPVSVNVVANDTDTDNDSLTVTGTSNGPANGTVTNNGDGTVTYTPNLGFAGTDTFTYAISDGKGGTASATVTITVTKRSATVTAGSGTKVFGTADPVLTPSSTGFLAGDNIVVTQTARDAGDNVGTYATHAEATGATLANYDVTVTNGTLEITIASATATATGGTFTYDGQPHGGTCSVAPVTGTDVLTGTISYSPGSGEPVAAGSYTVTCDFAGTNNYAATSGTASITINKATATVTAGSDTKVYGTADPVLTPSATGFLATDNIVVTQTAREGGENVGTYATHATATGAALVNYDVTTTDGTLVITQANAVATATGGTFTYDGQSHGGTCSVAPVTGVDVLTGTISYSPGTGAPVTAGSYTVTCDFAGTNNYAADSGTATVVIERAPATVTAGSGTKVYGTADPVLTPSSTGFLSGDNVVVTQTARDAGDNVGTYATHAIATGATLANYDVTVTDGTLEITIASATATATGGTFTYDAQPHGGACSVVPVTGADVLTGTISYSPGTGEPVSAGTYTVTCDFAGTNNYAATSSTATLTINRATATVTAGSNTKVYGTADPVLVPSATGFLSGDAIVVTQTAREGGENVGTYATHAMATGAALANYDVTTIDGTLVILKATAVATATGGTFTYDGQSHAGTCSVTPVTGADVLTGTISYSPGSGAPVTAGSYTVTCNFAGTNNYAATSGTETITINKATATVTAGSDTKVYGTADPVLTPSATGFLPVDGIVVTQTARDGGENVGTYATHADATGAALVNYDVTTNDGTLVITPAAVVVVAPDVTVTYDGQPHGTTCSFTGVGTDVLTGTTTYSSGNEPVAVGSYTATCSPTASQNYTTESTTATITINAAPLTVTANSYTRSYLAADPAFAGVLTGVIAGDGITATYSSTGAGSQVPGVYPTVPALVDPNGKVANYGVSSTNGTLTITNTAPVCVAATASPASIWPPNHQWVPITINGVTDLDGGPLAITITSIFQDEPTNTNGDGQTSIDGRGIGTSTASVRAERMGKSWKSGQGGKSDKSGKSGSKNSDKSDKGGGNGRVYHITFTATDSLGMTCTGTVLVGVPHDQSGPAAVDDGALYDSTVPTPNKPKSTKSTKSGKSEKSSKSNDKSNKSSDNSGKKSSKNNKPGSPAVSPTPAPKGKK